MSQRPYHFLDERNADAFVVPLVIRSQLIELRLQNLDCGLANCSVAHNFDIVRRKI